MRPPTAQETQYKSGLRNIGQIVSAHARLSPDKIATRDSRRAFTFSQWNQRACRLANALTGLGLVKGDRVAVLAYNRVEWMEIYAALAKVGLVIVPLNFRLIGPEIGYIAEHCGARALIVQDELADRVEGMRGGLDIPEKNWIRLGDEAATRWTPYEALIDGASDREPDTPVAPTDTWALMYTSGTTGKPKGVIRNHQGSALMSLVTALDMGMTLRRHGVAGDAHVPRELAQLPVHVHVPWRDRRDRRPQELRPRSAAGDNGEPACDSSRRSCRRTTS
jgi:acyl-CoA synthetase (AMP-forming)/AMP-acid ligase II